MSEETEREEIKDESNQLEDQEQDELEEDVEDEDWTVSMIVTWLLLLV